MDVSQRVQTVPFFKEKNELRFEGNAMASVFQYNGLQVNVAYSLSNHLGMFANYSLGFADVWDYEDSERKPFNKLDIFKNTEFAAGYYHFKNTRSIEVFVGYGNGLTDSKFHFDRWLKSRYAQYFVQPAYNFIINDPSKIAFSISLRFSYLNYYEFDYNLVYTPTSKNLEIMGKTRSYVLEPVMTY